MRRLTRTRWIPQDAEVRNFEDVQAIVYLTNGCCALGYAGKAVKPSFNYRFRSTERRESYISEWVEGLRDSKRRKDADHKAKSDLLKQPHPFKVGDIFYNSWGYEQTNIDWYQCVEVSDRSIVLREICASSKETGYMQGETKPLKDHFVKDAKKERKLVQVTAYNGKASYHINAKYGCMSPWDGKPKHYTAYA